MNEACAEYLQLELEPERTQNTTRSSKRIRVASANPPLIGNANANERCGLEYVLSIAGLHSTLLSFVSGSDHAYLRTLKNEEWSLVVARTSDACESV